MRALVSLVLLFVGLIAGALGVFLMLESRSSTTLLGLVLLLAGPGAFLSMLYSAKVPDKAKPHGCAVGMLLGGGAVLGGVGLFVAMMWFLLHYMASHH